jgi:hypothetical protein
MTNKTLSDEEVSMEIGVKKTALNRNIDFYSDGYFKFVDIKKHLQEFKEELSKFINNYQYVINYPENYPITKQLPALFERELNTQMQKHFGDKLI